MRILGIVSSYRMRLRRKRCHLRAFLRSRDLTPVQDRTRSIRPGAIMALSTLRNERVRLPFFLRYYRDLGVNHFLMVDNGSDDGSAEYLAAQPDVSLWRTEASYKRSHFGVDWLTWLQRRYCHGHWTLDGGCGRIPRLPVLRHAPLRALTDWLDASSLRSFSAMLLDMYPKGPDFGPALPRRSGPVRDRKLVRFGQLHDFAATTVTETCGFRAAHGHGSSSPTIPVHAPALNKIPLVKWHRNFAYASSTHMLLPRGLNQVYDTWGGEKASGCLLHAKFLDTFASKAKEEMTRAQHYANSQEYKAYRASADSADGPVVQMVGEIHQLAPARDSGADVQG